jgi:hypothetical protein
VYEITQVHLAMIVMLFLLSWLLPHKTKHRLIYLIRIKALPLELSCYMCPFLYLKMYVKLLYRMLSLIVSSFAFVVIKGQSLIKIISARNQNIIMVYESVIKVDIYGVGLANTRAQL